MPSLRLPLRFAVPLAILVGLAGGSRAQAQNWPYYYDPFVVPDLHLTISSQDWNTVTHDTSYLVDVPGYINLPGETPLLVAVRRKSSTGVPSNSNPQKVGIKIDINEYVPGQTWHKLKKLSLENGADTSTLLEGFAWYLHRLAWMPGGYPYMPGLAHWVKLYVNGVYNGVYVDVEQVDKRFLENRGLWLEDDSWLYKASDVGSNTLEFPSTPGYPNSPTYTTLCYSPFPVGSCATPAPAALATELDQLLNMQGMLTLGAVNIWCFSPDNLFSKGKNFFYADFDYDQRHFYSWDMDANFGPLNATKSIYEVGNSPYEDLILDNAAFRPRFDGIMRTLVNGPFATSNLIAQINSLQNVLLPAMSTDPWDPLTVAAFDELRSFVTARNPNVLSQLPANVDAPAPASPTGIELVVGPNPVATRAGIAFGLSRPGRAQVAIYDVRGALMRRVLDADLGAGRHKVFWEPFDGDGRRVGAGVYFVDVRTPDLHTRRQIVVLK